MSYSLPNVPGNWKPPIISQTSISIRLDELLGDIHLSNGEWEVDLNGMYSAAVAEVADLVPGELLVDYSKPPAILSVADDSIYVTGHKVLYVRRQMNLLYADGPYYECREVTLAEFQKANVNVDGAISIYAPTAETPIYVISPFNGRPTLQILPLPEAGIAESQGEVFLFQYPTALPDANEPNVEGMPLQLVQAVLLRTATHVLNAYLAWAVHEEEDNEIVALVSAQIQAYQSAYQAEMKRFMEGASE